VQLIRMVAVSCRRIAHRCKDSVSGASQGFGGVAAEAGAGARDQDGFLDVDMGRLLVDIAVLGQRAGA